MTKLDCFIAIAKKPDSSQRQAIPIIPLMTKNYKQWLQKQTLFVKKWCQENGFQAASETYCLIPNEKGGLAQVILGIADHDGWWAWGVLPGRLPAGHYFIAGVTNDAELRQAELAWGLGAYRFTRYKKSSTQQAKLLLPKSSEAIPMVQAIYHVRNLINTPTEDMGPAELSQAAVALGKEFSAVVKQIKGEELVKKNYPAIYMVGRASQRPPRLVEIRWGKENHPKVTLLGKGVCFDSGGLDLKPPSAMALMKKDMAGAAHALGLARLVMQAHLPLQLRVLMPMVENVISGNAYKPGDIIHTRKGITVEVGNTDAEGRLILADALTAAAEEEPELIIDFATLTGAARVAVGTDIAAMFTNDDALAETLLRYAENVQDPIWRLPLYMPYRKMLDSAIADINNASNSSYAGAITAALFLKEFVPDTLSWVHFDMMAWNSMARPGRPEGAEVMGLRAVFYYLQSRYGDLKK